MTRQEAIKEFKNGLLESGLPKLYKDKPAFRQSWNEFTDYLCKGGKLMKHLFEVRYSDGKSNNGKSLQSWSSRKWAQRYADSLRNTGLVVEVVELTPQNQ